jgi:hypothetical protein
MEKDTLRMQFLSGVITEGQYKIKLHENEVAAVGKKVEAAVEDKLEATVDNLSDEQKAQLKAELAKAGINSNSKIEDVAGKLDESLFEGEGDTNQKVANILSGIGKGLIGTLLVPLIPVAIGHYTGIGFAGGLAATFGAASALIGLAKLLEKEPGSSNESLNESMIGGIVGIGAINQIPPRAKADYETAFEHFLGEKYGLNEEEKINEGEQTIRSKSIKDYILSQIKLYPMYSAQLKSFESNIKNNQDLTEEEAKEIIEKFIKKRLLDAQKMYLMLK